MSRTWTDPEVFAAAARGEPWADPETDPTRIDWAERQRQALIPFRVIDGRPVNPCQSTGIRYGRNQLGHWGEQPCADAIVTVTDNAGTRWLLMVERSDGHGWAMPGGYVEPGEDPIDAAVRELAEETGLMVYREHDHYVTLPPRYVPDPRASDEAWMVTVPVRIDLGGGYCLLPEVEGRDDARRAAWIPANTYVDLAAALAADGGQVFAAHRDLLRQVLDGEGQ